MTNPEKIQGPIGPKSVEGIKEELPQGKPSSFESYMKEGAPGNPIESAPGGTTPIALAQTGPIFGVEPTLSSLLGQVESIKEQSKKTESFLRSSNLKLKRSHQKLLDTKLNDSKDHIQSAAKKLGAKIEEAPEIKERGSPVAKFLGYLTQGESQLINIQSKLKDISAGGNPLPIADMLLIQAKLSQAQQAVEFSAIMLNNVISGLKQIMSIQI
ncbi:MAG: hypothetical protein WCP39_06990 [Chlamydiota bacterium]